MIFDPHFCPLLTAKCRAVRGREPDPEGPAAAEAALRARQTPLLRHVLFDLEVQQAARGRAGAGHLARAHPRLDAEAEHLLGRAVAEESDVAAAKARSELEEL